MNTKFNPNVSNIKIHDLLAIIIINYNAKVKCKAYANYRKVSQLSLAQFIYRTRQLLRLLGGEFLGLK